MPVRTTQAKPRKKIAKSARKSASTRASKRPKKGTPAQASPTRAPAPSKQEVQAVLARLEQMSTARDRENLGRFGITASKSYGVSMANMQKLAKSLGRSHELAAALWDTGWYEARTLAALVEDPALVTPAQMDRWCGDFDNWAICDTACFLLFDRTSHAWAKVEQWGDQREEFIKRAAFALLASLALHDKGAGDPPFIRCLPLVERAATDERNFVKKGVSWALRGIGRRNQALNAASVKVARRLEASDEPAARWVGKDALRDLTSPERVRRLAVKRGA